MPRCILNGEESQLLAGAPWAAVRTTVYRVNCSACNWCLTFKKGRVQPLSSPGDNLFGTRWTVSPSHTWRNMPTIKGNFKSQPFVRRRDVQVI